MKKLNKKQMSELMSTLAKHRWAIMSKEEKSEFGRKRQAKRKKKLLTVLVA